MCSVKSHSSSLILTGHSVYNNPDYSDLTIVLKDGREIKVHKNIMCTNEWFKKACGAHSQFAVSCTGSSHQISRSHC